MIKSYVILFLILLVSYFYCIKFAPSIESKSDNIFFDKLNNIHQSCIIKCNSTTCRNIVQNGRGDTYFISTPKEKQEYIKDCAVTFWGVSHFFMHFMIGFLLPDFFLQSLAVGISFEIYEYQIYKCHDILDIPLNILGFLMGRTIRITFNGKNNIFHNR
jgi:hypothetical protein